MTAICVYEGNVDKDDTGTDPADGSPALPQPMELFPREAENAPGVVVSLADDQVRKESPQLPPTLRNYEKSLINKKPSSATSIAKSKCTHCDKMRSSSSFWQITEKTSAGKRNWSQFRGSMMCDACYSAYRKTGYMARNVRAVK